MVWAPGYGGASVPDDETGIRCGVVRSTMKSNTLLSKAGVGEVHKTSFVNLPPNHVYGYEPPKDPENAKQVVNNWKPHVANPHSKPGPDFKAMNKLATMNGLTGAPQQRSFRDTHMILMKEGRPLTPPPLPSDKNPKHVYGQPTSHRTMDECRHLGSFEPKLKNVIQGDFQYDWVKANIGRTEELTEINLKKTRLPPPAETKASQPQGHALGATRYTAPPAATDSELWKMSKFSKVESKVAPEWKDHKPFTYGVEH